MAKRKKNASQSKAKLGNPRPEIEGTTSGTVVPGNRAHRSMVSEAAYYRAMSRGFDGGNPIADWLEAEKEITARLNSE